MGNNYSSGLFYKKELDSTTGKVKSQFPFLPKTLSRLIIRNDGTNAEASLVTIEKNLTDLTKTVQDMSNAKSYRVFATKEEYDTAYEAGEVNDTLCIVTND